MRALILLILICTIPLLAHSQKKDKNGYRGGEVECLASNYEFRLVFPITSNIPDKLVPSGQKIYVCDSSLPLVVQIIDKTTGTIASGGSNHQWSGPIVSDYGGIFEGQITSSTFSAKNVIKYEFDDTSGSQKLNLKIFQVTSSNLVLNEKKTHNLSALAFDENNIADYPFFGTGTPWKFLNENQSDNVFFKNKIKGGVDFIEFEDFPINNAFQYNPSNLELTILDNANGIDAPWHNEVFGCGVLLFRTNAYPIKNVTIDVYILSDSDDDIPNYCPTDRSLMPDCTTKITNPDHDCILPGADLTLDLYDNVPYYINNLHNPSMPRDEFLWLTSSSQPHTLRIKPSHHPALANPYYCNSIPLPNHTHSGTPTHNIPTFEKALNDAYNKVGINITLNFLGVIHANIDSRVDDNKINDRREQNIFHGFKFGYILDTDEILPASTTEMWFVEDILTPDPTTGTYNQSYGRATGNENTYIVYNTFALNSSFTDFELKYTAIHELGHAKYELWHPDDIGGIEGDGLYGLVTDKSNFMSKAVNRTIQPDKFKIRKYQWEKIKK